MRFKYFILGVSATIAVFAVAFISFYLGKSFRGNPRTESTAAVTATISPLPTTGPSKIVDKSIEISKAAEKAVLEQDYSNLEDYLSESIIFRIENSGCCNPQSPASAIKQLEYLSTSEGTWDFDRQGTVAKALEASYPEHYSNAIIGVSDDGFSAAFQLDEKKEKIVKISLSAAYTLLLE